MRKLKNLLLTFFAAVMLTACDGHGFEGEYAVKYYGQDHKEISEWATTLTLGTEYVEVDGKRTVYDSIEVRVTDEGKFLVFIKDDHEEPYAIVDDSTLRKPQDGFGAGEVLTRK